AECSSCTEYPVFTPSALVVKYGDPANVTCDVCQKDCSGDVFGLEHAVGNVTKNGTTMFWTVDRLTEWEISLLCFYTSNQCTSILNPTLYRKYPPESVSISFVNHTEMMFENQQYTLQCSVQNVAPVQNLTVTFYRGNTALGHLQSRSKQKKPVSETFTLNITPSREDDGAQYWCETKLELGPAGPQRPPVVTSEKLNYLNVEKTKEIIIDFRRTHSLHTPLTINSAVVERVSSWVCTSQKISPGQKRERVSSPPGSLCAMTLCGEDCGYFSSLPAGDPLHLPHLDSPLDYR
uniref:Ig-like domain-containing protein n=1 Tax=Neolamprologus brichardi TaxID=32507 RepID=A0A3Q4GZ92_NEOBR